MQVHENAIHHGQEQQMEFEEGYNDCWRNVPFLADASSAWKQGWRNANLELWGDDGVEA